MAEHEWTTSTPFEPFCRDYGCHERMTSDEAERRLNAFDALVEAAEAALFAFTEVVEVSVMADAAGRLEVALLLARGDSEVRA